MNVIFEDESIIVIYKPSGLATQTSNIASKDCVSMIKEHLRKNNPNIKTEPYVGIVHRLDQPVSGILVFAKNQNSAAKLSAQVGGVGMNKVYRATVEGILEADANVELRNVLYKDATEKRAVVVDNNKESVKTPKGVKLQEAILTYSVNAINIDSNTSDISIVLQTGRFHQIRAQLSHIGHPIAGDRKYGSTIPCPSDFAKGENNTRGAIALEANSLSFSHPKTGKRMEFTL